MCNSISEGQAEEYDAVRGMLCLRCIEIFDKGNDDTDEYGFEKDNTSMPLDEYEFCDECMDKINKYYEERYNE